MTGIWEPSVFLCITNCSLQFHPQILLLPFNFASKLLPVVTSTGSSWHYFRVFYNKSLGIFGVLYLAQLHKIILITSISCPSPQSIFQVNCPIIWHIEIWKLVLKHCHICIGSIRNSASVFGKLVTAG